MWVNAHHNDEYIWVDKDGKGGWKVPSGKGQRLIVLHAGGANGWVEGADLVFTSKTNSTDYHDEMNSDHYIEWLNDIIPTLDKQSVQQILRRHYLTLLKKIDLHQYT